MEHSNNAAELPEELQREIFIIAAQSSRSLAALLLTLDKRVYHWCVLYFRPPA